MIAYQPLPSRTNLMRKGRNVARVLTFPLKANQQGALMGIFGDQKTNRIMEEGTVMPPAQKAKDQVDDGDIQPTLKKLLLLEGAGRRRRRRKRRTVGRGLRMHIPSRKRVPRRRRRREAKSLQRMVILILGIASQRQSSLKMQKADSTAVLRVQRAAEGNLRQSMAMVRLR
jgi:hypothetical protein